MFKLSQYSDFFAQFFAKLLPFIGLAKVPLCLLIGCSTLFGYLLASPLPETKSYLTSLAVFILATGCASLNSFQEYKIDGRLNRTKSRPLVLGQLQPVQALVQSCLLISLGLLLVFWVSETKLPLTCALLSVIFYNGIYTPLKAKSAWAIIPGAVCGAFPPYIGWLVGGGVPICYPVGLLIALLLLWQVPHFWLILLKHKDDYIASSLPNLLQQLPENRLKGLFVTWIGGLAAVMVMYAVVPLVPDYIYRGAIVVNAIILAILFYIELVKSKSCNYGKLFVMLNCSFFLHMLLVSVGRLGAGVDSF